MVYLLFYIRLPVRSHQEVSLCYLAVTGNYLVYPQVDD